MGAEAIRAGIVGGGFMGEVHARSIRVAGGIVEAVVSASPESTRAAVSRLGAARAHASFTDLIADPGIDVIHICTPNATHLEFAVRALEAGKHVVCEKPLAISSDDTERLVDLAGSAGVVATVPFVYRFHPMVREIRHRLAGGRLGVLTTIQGAYLQDWLVHPDDDNWRVGALGGPSRAFADIGSHLVDLIEFATQDRVARLTAQTRTVHEHRGGREAAVETEDLVTVLVETVSGAIGTLVVSQVAPGRKNALSIEFSGTQESYRFDQENPEQVWIGRRTGSELLLRNPEELGDEARRLSTAPAGHALGYLDAFAAFVTDSYRAVAGERPDGLPTFEDGHRAALLTESVLDSSRRGDWVEVGVGTRGAVV